MTLQPFISVRLTWTDFLNWQCDWTLNLKGKKETSAIKSLHGEARYNSERQLLGEMEAWGMCRFATN